MAENRNIELNDKIMANATGGAGEASLPAKYSVGDSINIRYNPAKPTEIDLGSASTRSGIFMALGCMIAGIIAGIAFIKVR